MNIDEEGLVRWLHGRYLDERISHDDFEKLFLRVLDTDAFAEWAAAQGAEIKRELRQFGFGKPPIRFLDCFSGSGMFSLGLKEIGWECVGHIESDKDCQKLLEARFPGVPLFGDICETTVAQIREQCGRPDAIVGSPPCQSFSAAGQQKGMYDPRGQLYWQMWRLVRRLRPRFVLIENVPSIRTKGVDWFFLSLRALNYSARAFLVEGQAVGSPQKRDRMWLVATLRDGMRTDLVDPTGDLWRASGDQVGNTFAGIGSEVGGAAGTREREREIG